MFYTLCFILSFHIESVSEIFTNDITKIEIAKYKKYKKEYKEILQLMPMMSGYDFEFHTLPIFLKLLPNIGLDMFSSFRVIYKKGSTSVTYNIKIIDGIMVQLPKIYFKPSQTSGIKTVVKVNVIPLPPNLLPF